MHVVHALDSQLTAKTAAAIRKLEAALEKGAAEAEDVPRQGAGSPVLAGRDSSLTCVSAPPDEAIVQLAVDVDADLVVVGTTPRKGIAKLVHSSVSGKVLKHAECPVLLVRKKDHAGMAKTPRIEPACAKCQAIRSMSGGSTWWCERHAEHAALPLHVYSYHREQLLRSEVPPGGT